MAAQEFRVSEVLELADRLVNDGHPEVETINSRKEVFLILNVIDNKVVTLFLSLVGIERGLAKTEAFGAQPPRKAIWSA